MQNLNLALESQAQSLAFGWVRHFAAADAALPYTHYETARVLQLSDTVLLAGIIDAEGDDFFAEFKTASPRGAKTWKKEWLLSPQALTYGLLTGGKKRFLVRKAFKSATPSYDHEWFEFGPHDLIGWQQEVLMIAAEIKTYRDAGFTRWPLNFEHGCFAYGPNYACPYWEHSCSKFRFDGPAVGATLESAYPGSGGATDTFDEFRGDNRLVLTDAMNAAPNSIILTATRIKNWMRCREKYRRDQTTSFEPSDALLLGSRFHELIANYNRTLIAKREKQNG
jgi:hypothetical protein